MLVAGTPLWVAETNAWVVTSVERVARSGEPDSMVFVLLASATLAYAAPNEGKGGNNGSKGDLSV